MVWSSLVWSADLAILQWEWNFKCFSTKQIVFKYFGSFLCDVNNGAVVLHSILSSQLVGVRYVIVLRRVVRIKNNVSHVTLFTNSIRSSPGKRRGYICLIKGAFTTFNLSYVEKNIDIKFFISWLLKTQKDSDLWT